MTTNSWQDRASAFGHRIPAPAILILALVLIQVSSGTARYVMTVENAIGLGVLRCAFGGLLLCAVLRPNIAAFSKRQWTDAILLGAVYAFFIYSVYQALAHLPLGIVATVGFLGPLGVSLLGSRRLVDAVWPLLGFVGVALLAPTSDQSALSWSSLFWGFAYALAWALYIPASKRAGASIKGLDGFAVATVIATLLLAPFTWEQAAEFTESGYLFWMAVLVAVLSTVPFSLEFISLKRMEPRVFGVLLSLEPAIASVIGIIMLSEFLELTGWIAIAAVTIASMGVTLFRRQD